MSGGILLGIEFIGGASVAGIFKGVAGKVLSKAESSIWKDLGAYRGGTKTNGLSGARKRYYEWDRTHGDIEVYDSSGIHLGSMDARTGDMIKPPVTGRDIKDKIR